MPDQDHLILVLARDAEEITRDMSVFFAPTRDLIEPGADWPPDLGPGELAALIPQLRLTIGHLADVLGQIIHDSKGDPDKAKLVSKGVGLIEQGEQAVRAGETLFGVPASPPGTRPQPEVAAHRTSRTGLPSRQPPGLHWPRPRPGRLTPARPGRAPAPAPGIQADRTRPNR